MSLPNIDFQKIRLHGNQSDAFEELCCQLASDDASPNRTRFDRKGRGGDGGVECYETLADGSEIGWQVKYYSDIGSMLRSLDGSLDKALVKHPKMRKFIACFPFDLADARVEDTVTAYDKWTNWCKKRVDNALKAGRKIEIERWDAHALRNMLISGDPRNAGRVAFWFDQQLLTQDWLNEKFEKAKASLGERYDPEGNIDLPISLAIRAISGDPALFDELGGLASAVRTAATKAYPIAGTSAEKACADAAEALHGAAHSKIVDSTALYNEVSDAADAAFQLHDDLAAANGDKDPSADMRAVSDLAGTLRSILIELRQPHWALLNRQSLLIHGAAGSGKSHLLADACARQLAVGRPALLVLGGAMIDAEPWNQILQHLDLPRHLEVGQFLGALNAAGEAAGVRALVAIDALNEKNGQEIWPERLAGLLHDIRDYPWIAVVLSCRTTYLDLVIPDTLDATALPRIAHRGFSIAEVRAYLRARGLSLPETPFQISEFQTPLFLRLYCDALDFEGETLLGRGLGGVTDIFRAYTNAVTRRVHRQLKIPPGRDPAAKTLSAIAREMVDTGRGELLLASAEAIAHALHPGRSVGDDLLFQLENEGMLAVEPYVDLSGNVSQTVRFTFERIGDHIMAADLLSRGSAGGPASLCAAGTALHAALHFTGSRIVPGLLEALAVQLPENFDLELPDLAGLPTGLSSQEAFVKSLKDRRLDAMTDRTWKLVEDHGGAPLRYDTLIALATEPAHPNNARFLDAGLRALSMPERDATWSAYLARTPNAAFHLIDWIRTADVAAIAADRAELAAIQLCWFLTTSRRAVRDKATKALVVLLAGRAELAMTLWRAFAQLDDLYLVERLAAALYGAAMQGWSLAELRAAAELLHADLYAHGSPPANLLLRDHAIGLIGYAAMRGALPPEFDLASSRPPFSSPWPIEKISEDQISSFTAAYGVDDSRHRDDIVSSLRDGDFARYVLDSIVRCFSAAPRGTDPLPTAQELRDQWFAEFANGASEAELAAHATLEAKIAAIKGSNAGAVHANRRDDLRAAKRDFRDAIGSERYEDWRARAENWRDEGMYQIFGVKEPASFNLAWARRWVTWRAHDLGWTESLHHMFDREIRTGRNGHEVERIGKKYQWLATYELAARMEDNLAKLPDEDGAGPSRLRDIDPSMLHEQTGDDGWRSPRRQSFWAPYRPSIEAASAKEALAWVHSDAAIIDGRENIEVNGKNGQAWLVLTGFEIWEENRASVRSESWRRIGCTIARAADRDKLLDRLADVHMTGHHDMPVGGADGYHMHLGEHPWAWPDRSDEDGWIKDWRPNGRNWRTPGVDVRPPTAEYSAESGGYDYSISQNITINLPAGWLMRSLGLILSDGRSIEYRDAQGRLLFVDPSVGEEGRNAALVDRSAFLDLLRCEELVAVWAVAGEKSVFGDIHSDGFGGRRAFTRLFVSDGGELEELPRYETFDKPSRRQRAALLGENTDDLSEEDEDEGEDDGDNETETDNSGDRSSINDGWIDDEDFGAEHRDPPDQLAP